MLGVLGWVGNFGVAEAGSWIILPFLKMIHLKGIISTLAKHGHISGGAWLISPLVSTRTLTNTPSKTLGSSQSS